MFAFNVRSLGENFTFLFKNILERHSSFTSSLNSPEIARVIAKSDKNDTNFTCL